MTLAAGTRLGAYEILAPLGAGGMGEVYRARDPRLGREVAVKVLPDAVALDPNRLLRFEQEARAASALNHPNIVTIHEIGREGKTAFIAMELVDGRTLRELTASGPMAVRRVLNVAAQIAEGLSKAHSVGIVHRDLKPENVMVSKDGFVKILDFGLAKLVEPESGEVSAMPTLAQPETHPGTVMGTVGYMSPEQASGEPLDFRSDQFSLGSIVYEMTTGKKAFERKTTAETMSAIIREEPEPVGRLRPDLPLPARWILERCLSKGREERYASTRDLARDLASLRDHISEVTSGAETMLAAPGKSTRRAGRVAIAAGLAVAAALVGGLVARLSQKAAAPSFKRLTFRAVSLANARFAPDGQTIVYGLNPGVGAAPLLYMTRAQGSESRPFEFPGDILSISRSGELAIRQQVQGGNNILATVPMAGGAPRQILNHVNYAGADWSPDGKALVVVHELDDRSRLEFPIGRVLATGVFASPRFSPDGRTISFWEDADESGSVNLIDSLGKSKRTLSKGWAEYSGVPCWAKKGREIWFTAGKAGGPPALWAVDLSGQLRLVIRVPGALELDDISEDGRVLLAHHTNLHSVRGLGPGQSREVDLSWLDDPIPADLSPDGAMLLLNESGEGTGAKPTIYLRGTDGRPALRLAEGWGAALSPDKQWVLAHPVVGPGKPSRPTLVPTGPGEPKELPMQMLDSRWGAFTPDGKGIVFAAIGPDGKSRLYVQEIPTGVPRAISPNGVEIQGQTSPVSPDGRYVVGFREGRPEVYPLDGSGEGRVVPGVQPGDRVIQWSADSRSVYVYSPQERPLKVFLLDLETGRKRLWKEFSLDESAGFARVRVTPDGRYYVYGARTTFSELYLVEGLR
ncbi:MAG TPA: protein kinase [Thermoanaerobaculia bacterium]